MGAKKLFVYICPNCKKPFVDGQVLLNKKNKKICPACVLFGKEVRLEKRKDDISIIED